MAKNETEAVQLMMYASEKVNCYNVVVSDLICGDAVIPAKSIENTPKISINVRFLIVFNGFSPNVF